MSALTEIRPYVEAFKARDRASEPGWLAQRREGAMQRFAELGFPTRKQEMWRFTNLRPLQNAAFPPAALPGKASAKDIAPWRLEGATHRLVLVDGGFAPELSDIGALPKGVWLASTAQTLKERPKLFDAALRETDVLGNQPFVSLNAALFADGFVLALEPGAALAKPVEILHWASGAAGSFHTRNLVLLGDNSRATLSESFAGTGSGWSNAVGVIGLGKGASLTHVKLQDEAAASVHLAQTRVELGGKARYESFTLALGARLSRHDLQVKFDGEGAGCVLDGAFLLRGEQEGTIATFVDHAAPGCVTREYFKGVADGSAHGVFLGTIAVRPQAQKTDAQQLNKNLLLSRRAAIDTKPELDILADDVKCSHGATVGDLDETALFYLESRGIALADARKMLIEAFAIEAVERVADKALRAHLTAHVARWLAGSVA